MARSQVSAMTVGKMHSQLFNNYKHELRTLICYFDSCIQKYIACFKQAELCISRKFQNKGKFKYGKNGAERTENRMSGSGAGFFGSSEA
jgi:hypothetical protein